MSVAVYNNQKCVSQKASIIKPGVELIGIINKRGRMTESIGACDLDIPSSKKEMFLMKIALRTSMQKDFDDDLGPVNYSMTQRGDKKFISIPTFNDYTILVVTKTGLSHEEIVRNVIETLRYCAQFLGEQISEKEKDGN